MPGKDGSYIKFSENSFVCISKNKAPHRLPQTCPFAAHPKAQSPKPKPKSEILAT